MRLHQPVHHTKQPHLSGIPSYADGGSVGFSNSVDAIGGTQGGSSQMTNTPAAGNSGGGGAAPSSQAQVLGGGNAGGIPTETMNNSVGSGGPASDTSGGAPNGSPAQVGQQAGGDWSQNNQQAAPAAPAANPAAAPSSGGMTPQELGVKMGQGALAKAASNWQALNPAWKEPTWLSNAAGTSGSQGGVTSQPAAANPASTGSTIASTAPAAVGSSLGSYAEGGEVKDSGFSNSLNPLNNILGKTIDSMKQINKKPQGIPTEGPAKEQAGPYKKSENNDYDDEGHQNLAEGGAVNDEDQGVVDPQSLLGGQQPQASQPADNAAVPDPGNTLGGPAPSAGAQTVSGLVSSAKQSYQTVQQALQKAWAASKGTGQAAGGASAITQPNAQGQASGGGFAGNTAATGIPAPVSISPQAPSGQAQSAPLQSPTPSGAGNPIKPGAFPVQTTNVSGTPGGGQASAGSAGSPQAQVTANTKPPQSDDENG